jgi:tetratricopeptide (TPR) repeat protein
MLEEDLIMKNITHLFYNGDYELGRQEITQLIEADPDNSMLLSNRALFNSQLGLNPEAVHDLHAALRINPLNYIAYFNLFSIQTLNNEDHEAYENLCCSLSCLHLIKAKKTKILGDVEHAIKYAKNNLEARVLKGLILAQGDHF